jgi:hypothetical protein
MYVCMYGCAPEWLDGSIHIWYSGIYLSWVGVLWIWTFQVQKPGPFKWDPKHKMAIFLKMALTILNKFQLFTETVSLSKTA